jgi:hypothetical protein
MRAQWVIKMRCLKLVRKASRARQCVSVPPVIASHNMVRDPTLSVR